MGWVGDTVKEALFSFPEFTIRASLLVMGQMISGSGKPGNLLDKQGGAGMVNGQKGRRRSIVYLIFFLFP